MDAEYAYEYERRYTKPMSVSVERRRTASPGAVNGRPWSEALRLGQTACVYCRSPFTKAHPPTRDHIIPRALGGSLNDGFVLACHGCNSARGEIPFEEYMAAVEAEHLLAVLEDRPYRRPKRIDGPGGKVLLTLSKKERKLYFKAAAS